VILELDETTAKRLRQVAIDCSQKTSAAGMYSMHLPIVLVSHGFDRDCYIAGARQVLGDHILNRLLELGLQAELRILWGSDTKHIELKEE
jgi:hypothetical protein